MGTAGITGDRLTHRQADSTAVTDPPEQTLASAPEHFFRFAKQDPFLFHPAATGLLFPLVAGATERRSRQCKGVRTMAFQDPHVLNIIRFRERSGPKQDKRRKRLEKLSRKAGRRAQRESSGNSAA